MLTKEMINSITDSLKNKYNERDVRDVLKTAHQMELLHNRNKYHNRVNNTEKVFEKQKNVSELYDKAKVLTTGETLIIPTEYASALRYKLVVTNIKFRFITNKDKKTTVLIRQ